MWFLQARCGLLLTIINHNHILVKFGLRMWARGPADMAVIKRNQFTQELGFVVKVLPG